MATMYVYNIPTNETVNLRATPNGTILVRVPYGAAVEASPSATSGWHNASYNNYSGYIMSQCAPSIGSPSMISPSALPFYPGLPISAAFPYSAG